MRSLARETAWFAGFALLAACDRGQEGSAPRNAAEPVAQESAPGPRTAESRDAALTGELARLRAHAWAGRYSSDDGLTVSHIELAPQSGFAFRSRMGAIHEQSSGAVRETDGVLQLVRDLGSDGVQSATFPATLVPVPWGERRYLIEVNGFASFCAAVNAGWEPRSTTRGSFLLRDGDEARPVTGLPVVPAGYDRWLLAQPLETTVIEPPPARAGSATQGLTLAAGSRQGVYPDLVFFTDWSKLVVVAVADDTCTASVAYFAARASIPGPGTRCTIRQPADWLQKEIAPSEPSAEELADEELTQEKLTPENEAESGRRFDALELEIAQLPGGEMHEWAGSYYRGDHLGRNESLAVAPANGFAYHQSGCLGTYDLNWGSLSMVDGKLRFAFLLPNPHRYACPAELVPVILGERHYLLEPDQITRFLEKAGHGAFANDHDSEYGWFFGEGDLYFLRVGDETKPALGEPEFLDGYRR